MVTKVQVALDTTANPEVIVVPSIANAQRHDQIQWTQIANEPFTFFKLTAKKKTLHDPNVSATVITAGYDAPANSSVDYTIIVKDTKGGTHSTVPKTGVKGRPTTGGGGPTIKNN